MAVVRSSRVWMAGIAVACTLAGVLAGAVPVRGQNESSGANVSAESIHRKMQRWEFSQEVRMQEVSGPRPSVDLRSVRLTQEVYSGARLDLADLRLMDGSGAEVPYQLRVLRGEASDVTLNASRFNESLVDGNVFEVSLDLGDSPREHNEVEIATAGEAFRRLTQLEGSDDGKTWRSVTERHLVRYPNDRVQSQPLDNRRISYPLSRYRYLRLRIHPDPLVDRPRGDSAPAGAAAATAAKPPFEIQTINVKARFDIPEELVTWNVRSELREPVRARGTASSAWVIDLLAEKLPVDRLRVKLADAELARDYIVETAGPLKSDLGFFEAGSGTLSRRLGDPLAPLELVFGERQAARVRLITVDFSNRPPEIESIEVLAPARDIVFSADALKRGPLRLYFGNPKADAPNYDFARNLPAKLATPPSAGELSTRGANPHYQPEPQPLTERAPWLIYVVLGTSSIVVAVVLADIGRKAIESHDAASAAAKPDLANPS
ncbi:MAG: hypothetical protein RLY70_3140 [Planctomycetota bacterium]